MNRPDPVNRFTFALFTLWLLGLLFLAFALKALWLDHNYSDCEAYALIGVGLLIAARG